MPSNTRFLIATGLTFLTCFGPGAHVSDAQGRLGIIEGYYPTQLVPGQTAVLNVAMNGGRQNPIQSIEIIPSTGITVGALKELDPAQGEVWWEIPVTVARDAAPGTRTLVAVQPSGRTVPVTLTIAGHVPSISDLRIMSAQTNQPTVDFQFAASDQGGTFGESPSVWFRLSCGKEPEVGMIKGKLASGVVRSSVPNPRTLTGVGAPSAGPRCDLEVRVSDSSKVDSNTLKTTVEFK
jgi:hypothetical protein